MRITNFFYSKVIFRWQLSMKMRAQNGIITSFFQCIYLLSISSTFYASIFCAKSNWAAFCSYISAFIFLASAASTTTTTVVTSQELLSSLIEFVFFIVGLLGVPKFVTKFEKCLLVNCVMKGPFLAWRKAITCNFFQGHTFPCFSSFFVIKLASGSTKKYLQFFAQTLSQSWPLLKCALFF